MVSKCANPACGKPFQYLREGKLFRFKVRTSEPEARSAAGNTGDAGESARRLEHFWLCGRCAGDWTLALEQERQVVVVPLMKGYQKWRALAS
jgi:hypothetical protein